MAEIDGFDSARVALLDNNEKVVTGSDGLTSSGVFSADAETSKGVLNANLTGLEPQLSNISGSDRVVDVSGSGTGDVQLTLGVNDLPTDVTYKLIGYKKDDDGSYHVDPDTKPPFAVVELISHDSSGDALHMGLLKGKFSLQDKNMQSNSGNGQVNRATDSLQMRAVNRKSDKKIYKVGFEHDEGFDLGKFRSDVFPGSNNNGASTQSVGTTSSGQ